MSLMYTSNRELVGQQPSFFLDKPKNGWVAFTIGNCTINHISYINPFLLDDITDFVCAISKGESANITLDTEDEGIVIISANETQDISIADEYHNGYIDSIVHADIFKSIVNQLYESIKENFEDWIWWQLDDEADTKERQNIINRINYNLQALEKATYHPNF